MPSNGCNNGRLPWFRLHSSFSATVCGAQPPFTHTHKQHYSWAKGPKSMSKRSKWWVSGLSTATHTTGVITWGDPCMLTWALYKAQQAACLSHVTRIHKTGPVTLYSITAPALSPFHVIGDSRSPQAILWFAIATAGKTETNLLCGDSQSQSQSGQVLLQTHFHFPGFKS